MKIRFQPALILIGTPIFVLLLALLVVWDPLELFGVAMPRPGRVEVTRLGQDGWTQGWPVQGARNFHKTNQGTKILPAAWFRALELPTFNPFLAGERLADPAYLKRFGFLYDPEDLATIDHWDSKNDQTAPGSYNGPLPIGFAVNPDFVAPYANPPVNVKTKVVGLTCAACHTGRLDVAVGEGKTVGVLIEGGSAMINLGKFQEAVGKALAYTSFDKARLRRFAERVLANGTECPQDETSVEIIGDHVEAYVQTGIAGQDYAKEHKLYEIQGGFARTDALTLIGNRVFGLSDVDNQAVTDSPVNFPHLWDTAWFDWVQYNASIRMPLARNVGEALGVGAAVSPLPSPNGYYQSTVDVEGLAWMEDFLGGDNPLAPDDRKNTMLQPPRWSDLVAAVQQANPDSKVLDDFKIDNFGHAEEGKKIYLAQCQSCHLPPRDELRAELTDDKSEHWIKDRLSGKKFLRLKVIDLSEIGTDQNQAVNFYRRFAVVPNPWTPKRPLASAAYDANPLVPLYGSNQTISAEEGLFRITSLLRKEYFDRKENQFFQPSKVDQRRKLDRYRTLPIEDGPEQDLKDDGSIVVGRAIGEVIRANLGYKARPLDGIWATPPYFHNGSVPNLYQVLIPAEGRSARFYLGRTDFDPKVVGYKTDDFPGGFLMDTSLAGNSNGGHEFRNYSLEEFELALAIEPGKGVSREKRWRDVLSSEANVDDQKRFEAARVKTQQIVNEVTRGPRHLIQNPNFRGVRGVIGAELTETERWNLIAYLKTL